MSNSRNDISRIIQEIQKDQSRLVNMQPAVFESVVAELLTRNNELLEVRKNVSNNLDFIGKYNDQNGNIKSFAIETKLYQKNIEVSQIHSLVAKADQLDIDKSYFITNTTFSKAALDAAVAYKSKLELIDRSGLNTLIDQYRIDRELFANSIASQISTLKPNSILKLAYPESSDIDSIEPDNLAIDDEEKSALITVDRLPLRVLSRILEHPEEIRNLTPRQFEEFIADLLSDLGFKNVILTPRSGDGGKDIIAGHSVHGIPLTFYFECKKYAEGNKVQLDTMRSLLGTVAHDSRTVNKGILVTTSTFTRGCKEFILAESRVDGKDYDGILGWIDELKKEI
ncbi:MAG: restriction endonuclease [Nitrospirae bacterium]|nr:restriction endonuclease [Nitrospirota bacterium]